MVSVLDLLKQVADAIFARTDEEKARNMITVLNSVRDEETLASVLALLPMPGVQIPAVEASILLAKKRVEEKGDEGIYSGVAAALYEGFKGLQGPITDTAGTILTEGLKGGVSGVRDAFSGGINAVLDMALNSLESQGKVIPPAEREGIKKSLEPIVSLGLTLTVSSVLAELIHPTKEMGLGNVSHFIHETVGFDRLSESYIGPLREAMIEYPVGEMIRKATQPYDAKPGVAQMLLQRREISLDEYLNVLRQDGLQEMYVQASGRAAYRELSMRDMQRMFDAARPDPTWIDLKVRRMGYREEDVSRITESLNIRAIQKETGDIRALQRSQYKRGVISREEYHTKLAARGITESEAQEFIDAIDTERTFEDNDELAKYWELKFKNGRATEEDLRSNLSRLGKMPGYIDTRVQTLTEQKLGKLAGTDTEKTLSQSQIIAAYRLNLISRDAAIKMIDDLGWSTEDAILILDIEDKAQSDRINAEWIRAFEKMAVYLRMTRDDLYYAYLDFGKSEAWAEARIAYITQVVLGKEKLVETEEAAPMG